MFLNVPPAKRCTEFQDTAEVHLTPDAYEQAKDFAFMLRGKQNYFQWRGQDSDSFKAVSDNLNGKYAELAVYMWLRDRGFMVSYPDISEHDGKTKQRSWEPDLQLRQEPQTIIHVKSFDLLSGRYSWTITNSEREKDHELLKCSSEEYLALVATCTDRHLAYIAGFVRCSAIGASLPLRDMEKSSLQDFKNAIYNHDLQRLKYEERWSFLENHEPSRKSLNSLAK